VIKWKIILISQITSYEAINTILSNLFSSIDESIYSILDDITFVNSDIINDSYFEKILGTSTSNGILLIANSLLFGVLLYYSIKLLFAHFTYQQVENPKQFIFKLIIWGICINSSYFFIEQFLNIISKYFFSYQKYWRGFIP